MNGSIFWSRVELKSIVVDLKRVKVVVLSMDFKVSWREACRSVLLLYKSIIANFGTDVFQKPKKWSRSWLMHANFFQKSKAQPVKIVLFYSSSGRYSDLERMKFSRIVTWIYGILRNCIDNWKQRGERFFRYHWNS